MPLFFHPPAKGPDPHRHVFFPADFTAYELPTKKWMELIRPKMRLCVRVQDRDFVSPTVTVEKTSVGSSVHWHWSDDAR